MSFKNVFILSISFSISLSAQQFTVRGKIIDSENFSPIVYANVRVNGTALGTSSNSEGKFEIKVDGAQAVIIVSHIGYYSDTINVSRENNELIIALASSELWLPEVVIRPGENPADGIIRSAIERKKIRNRLLSGYEVEAYTKGVIRTTGDISAKRNSIGIGLDKSDTTELIISGIFENQSRGYFEPPDRFKEIILARKQSANFPPTINTLTGGRFIQNFYNNDVNFLGRDLPGPISEKAPDYYYYYIEKITSQDNKKVFQIHMEPDNPADPGFSGKIFIADSTYDLVGVDLVLNRAANTGGLFDTVNVIQQFAEYSGIFLPSDYRLFAKANLLGLVRIGFEFDTILFNYILNKELPPAIFDKAIVTVLPDADNKDSIYWQSIQTIPATKEEGIAYSRIDSLENIPISFLDGFSVLDTRMNLTENISVSAPLSMYHFSRVEGHSLDWGIFIEDALSQRLNTSLQLSHGFSDNKFRQDFKTNYLAGKYRTWEIKFNLFNKISVLFENSDKYGELLSTLVTLVSKNEFRDYYYTRGFGFEIEGEITPILKIRFGFRNRTDNSALINTDFSFFNREKTYRNNPAVYETRINSLKFGFDIDFRDYIEDGYYRRRTSLGKSFVLFSGDINYSDKSVLKSGLSFTTYELSALAYLRTFGSASLNLNIYMRLNDGAAPFQDLYAIPGNIDIVFKSAAFRTLNINEIVGDKILTINLTHDFRDEIFRWLNVPGLKNREIMLSLIFNAAIADITGKTQGILINQVKSFKHPFYELGFGIGQGLLPFKLEFMWKLNYRDGNNFRAGLNMPLL